MKIRNINKLQNTKFPIKSQVKEFKNETIKQNQTTMMSNSLAEIMGRSQISFKSENSFKNNQYKHICSEDGLEEKIFYDFKTGNLRHEFYNEYDKLKKSIEFIQDTKERITTLFGNRNAKTVITESEEGKVKREYNEHGFEVLSEETDFLGNKKITYTDYEKQRKLVKEHGIVKVFDLKTNQQVFSGDLVYSEVFDKEKNSNVTYNVITGNIIREKHFGKKDTLISDTIFDEKTGKILEKTLFGKKSSEYEHYEYNPITFRLKKHTSHQKGSIREREYDYQGQKIISDKEQRFDNNILIADIEYDVSTGIIKTKKTYREEDIIVHHYNEDGIVKEFDVIKDGKIAQKTILEVKTQAKKETFLFNYARNITIDILYFPNQQKAKETITSNKTHNILKETTYNPDGTKQEVYEYDELLDTYSRENYKENDTLYRRVTYTSDHKKDKETYYYEDGETKSEETIYNKDGSSRTIYFDRNGRVKDVKTNKGQNNSQTNNQNTSNNDDSDFWNFDWLFGTQKTTKVQTEEEKNAFLKRIENLVAKNGFSPRMDISDADMKTLADILGVEDYKILYDLDLKNYRKLASKYHPDMNEDKEKATTIMQILNALRHKN